MTSTEYWQGYHSARKGQRLEQCPFKYEPASAREWKRGFAKYQSEARSN